MRRTFLSILGTILGFTGLVHPVSAHPVSAQAGDGKAGRADAEAFFRERVLPVLEQNCFECHGGGRRLRAGLRLTNRDGILAGGDQGPAVDLEQPDASLLLRMTSYADESSRMPPQGKLSAGDLAVLGQWVRTGLAWDPSVEIAETEQEPERRLGPGDGRQGWSYRPLLRPEVPAVRDAGWVRNPIDAFLLARLEQSGLTPAPPAERAKWLRRVTYDLIGLPPTPQELDAFEQDESPSAFGAAVDRLLARPQYGEKWGRHWLDLVRYAETNGYERDSDKPHIWRYRDYVIDAFNADKPYDQFVREQIAGDELDEVTHESLVATGFQRLPIWDDEPPQGKLQARYDSLDDIVKTTSEAFLGMTLGCARCHDHKGDAITQEDYYSFMAFFHGVADYRAEGTLVELLTDEERRKLERAQAQHEQQLVDNRAALAEIEQDFQRREASLRAASGIASGLVDLTYRAYEGRWNELPDFDALEPVASGAQADGRFDLSVAPGKEFFGLVIEGALLVEAAGEYVFEIDSDDGTRLTLGGRDVVGRDGTHALGEPRRATATLPAGRVPARLDFFQWTGGAAVELSYWRAGDDLWRYDLDDPGPGWEREDFDDAGWSEGEGGFGTPGTPGSAVGTLWNSSQIWLRRQFEWSADDADDLVLVAHHDEEIEVFLNGVLALELGGYATSYAVFDVTPEARAAVRSGTNTIAIHAKNRAGDYYVHARPVRRAELAGERLTDLARGRRSLSATTRPDPNNLSRAIAERGAEVFEASELEHYRALRKERQRLERSRPRAPKVGNVVTENGARPADLFVHHRGNPASPGKRVEPRFPSSVDARPAQIPEQPTGAATSGRRRVLADWIANPENPLTARVMVNRIWQHHFQRGLVPTSNDFGELGSRPSHYELLDWLAAEFMERGWSVKEMHRLILDSNAYRMGYRVDDAASEVDPGNDLLWRFRMRRLGAEEVRDSILALTGELNLALGGPSFYSRIPAEALATSSRPNEVWGKSPVEEANRRSIYIKVKRSLPVPLLSTFDMADTDSSCPARFTTTQPGQALALLNSEFVNERAQRFAARLRAEAGDDASDQVRRAVRLALCRDARESEVREHVAYIDELQAEYGLDGARALEQFCLLVLNLNEFVYLD